MLEQEHDQRRIEIQSSWTELERDRRRYGMTVLEMIETFTSYQRLIALRQERDRRRMQRIRAAKNS